MRIRDARPGELAVVALHTMPFMEAAIGLYEGLGFRPAPELDVQISGPVARAFRLKL